MLAFFSLSLPFFNVSSFVQYGDDLPQLKSRTKALIESMASAWTEEERQKCIEATEEAFYYGGGLNSYLMGGEVSKSH